jgi:2,3-bisphosphoglycerate-dependent phosphoglycerate mutase
MSKLIMVRHGQSIWNLLNLFAGWVDVPLSSKGIEEALAAGEKIKDIPIDIIFTSALIRAQMTAMLAMSVHKSGKVPIVMHSEKGPMENWEHIYGRSAVENCIPVICAWQLNERMYGELQGLNKAETAEKFGAEQVQIWRRSYSTRPPGGESLEMTAARTIPYFEERIVPHLKNEKNVFIAAHGNSLRSIVMDLEHLSQSEVVKLEIPTDGPPIIYNYENSAFTRA